MRKTLIVLVCIVAVVVSLLGAGSAMPIERTAAAAAAEQTTTPTPTPAPTLIPAGTPMPTSGPEPTPPPTTQASIMAVGDLMCLSAQLSSARIGGEYVFEQSFAQIKPIISSADLAMGNLETLVAQDYPFTARRKYEERTITPEDGPPYTVMVRVGGSSRINAPESYLSAVVDSGFDVLVTANNHAFDRHEHGIEQTMQKLDEYGIAHTGSYASPEAKQPLVVTVNNINIGIVSYTDISNQKPNSSQAYALDRYNEEKLTADIAATKLAGADFIVVYIHWGNENTHKVTSRQKRMAQFIADAGADLILGSHSHCTQPMGLIETQRGTTPVIYSMGNFVGSMGRTINTDGVILNYVLEKNYDTDETTLIELTYIPTLCRGTDEGNFIVLPADLASIETSIYASSLTKSRNRTIDVLGTTIAQPQ
ncbi:MAG: CapA family protein [Clostridia bacterium]|jgi:poly-gamma-glutamate capsule biosynthesis protein CapA/YwtB (metallophosphatase superfamily)|nr:CapA family protein [Clostridia bacterium]MBT7121847.1 CapA family protein [Clostridia bacterium]